MGQVILYENVVNGFSIFKTESTKKYVNDERGNRMRTDEVFEVGMMPPVGVVPHKMYSWVLREENLGEPSKAYREELIDVPTVEDDEMLVCNIAAGVNFNGVWAALGSPRDVVKDKEFHIAGSESCAIVYEVGKNVTEFKVGDKVIVGGVQYAKDQKENGGYLIWGYEANWGAFSQFSKVKENQCVFSVPELTDVENASISATGTTAYRMLTHWKGNEIKKGDVVLIWGGYGGLGSIAIQIVKHFGGIPVAVVSDESKIEKCMELGAAGCINRKEFTHWGESDYGDDPAKEKQWVRQVLKFRRKIWKIVGEHKNPAIVFEHVGSDTMATSLFLCDEGGMVVTCGATSGYLCNIDVRYLWLTQKRIQGSHAGTKEDFHGLCRIASESDIHPFISEIYDWKELPLAHQKLYENKVNGGKLCILIGGNRNTEGVDLPWK